MSHLTRLLVSALFATCLVAFAANQTPKPKLVDKGKSVIATSESGDPVRITHSYLWMQHGSALAQLAKQVKAGTGDQALLLRLAGSSLSKRLLAANLDALPTASTPGGGSTNEVRLAGTPRGAKLLAGPELHRILNLASPLSKEDYAPKTMDYEKMVPDVVASGNEYVTSPIDGTITVSETPTGTTKDVSNFYYAGMQSYTGAIKNDQYVVDQSTNGTTMPIKSGQMFIVQMQFAAYAGTYTADLHISCTGPTGSWTVTIPMKLFCSSSNDYSVQLVGYNPHVMASPGHKFNVQFTVKPVNYRKPFFCFVTSNNNSGLTESTDPIATQFYVKSNAPMTVSIPCSCASNAQMQDFVDFTQMIRADNNHMSVVFTTVDIQPFQIGWHCGNLQSSYTAPLVQSFGGPSSFTETWLNPEVVIDGDGTFTFLRQETDNQGNVWNFNPKWTQDMGAYFSYKNPTQGMQNWGSYNQISGFSSWVKAHWEDIFTFSTHLHFWYAPGPEAQYFDGNMPPLSNGVFVMPMGNNPSLTIHRW